MTPNASTRSALYSALIMSPGLDPQLAASDPFYWADHALEELIAEEERDMLRQWNQIQEANNARNAA